ncbi:MAG: hypothetical protein QFX35_05585, partial [Candidatus Verstraetearchaeota archaeon]|nr:hypothetical protein [Candidatus Verstraetearchaeota archaeon]
VVNGGGFLCVSSISISDRSRSPEVYSRTVSRTLEVLRGSSRTVAFVGVVTGKGEFYNCLRIASRHGLLTRSELERAGFEQMELLRIASAVVGATSPTAEIRIHRGKEIIERETVAR